MDERRTAQVAAVAALAEPTRRRVYDHVAGRSEPVSRDEAAAALSVPRATAAFHLDRLVADGLLDVHYERRSGRSGPGAGRPAKLYRRAECTVSVSLPERRYDLAGQLLAAALIEAERSGERPAEALARAAHERGEQLGAAVADGADRRSSVLHVLAEQGFEPREEAGAVSLGNCPFHALAREHTELVCGMNLRLLQGVLDGVPGTGLAPRLQPSAGACCVRLEPSQGGCAPLLPQRAEEC
jgi:predicted ArsR family transcriptional regulator